MATQREAIYVDVFVFTQCGCFIYDDSVVGVGIVVYWCAVDGGFGVLFGE